MFSNMPICPFSKKARQDKKIDFAIHAFQSSKSLNPGSELLDLIRAFKVSQSYEALMVIHPNEKAFSLEEMKLFMQGLNDLIHPLGLIAFSGHPEDDFNIRGVFTRRDPFINFIVQDVKKLESSSKILKTTAYYDNWSVENLKSINQFNHQP